MNRSAKRWLVILVTSTAMLVAAGPTQFASAAPAQRTYLSLGDSLAFGFQRAKALAAQPPTAFDTGYANLLAASVEHGNHPLTLVNYGCPGESTVSYLTGPCPWTAGGRALHDPFTGPQQDAALAFLHAHRGRVDLITLSLWGNDANAFVASCRFDVQCITAGAPAAIATIATNLSMALGGIREAAPDAEVVLLGAMDANIGAFPLTHPLIQALNVAMADVAASHRAAFADPFPLFNPATDTTGATLCQLTLLCSQGDAHPSDAGYLVIAQLIQAQLRR